MNKRAMERYVKYNKAREGATMGLDLYPSMSINCYEDVVVYSSSLSLELINYYAYKYRDSIIDFEEIFYLLSYFTPNVLEKICLDCITKISKNTDLCLLRGRISDKLYKTLTEKRDSIIDCQENKS